MDRLLIAIKIAAFVGALVSTLGMAAVAYALGTYTALDRLRDQMLQRRANFNTYWFWVCPLAWLVVWVLWGI